MFCKNCGKKINNKDLFCKYCGESIAENNYELPEGQVQDELPLKGEYKEPSNGRGLFKKVRKKDNTDREKDRAIKAEKKAKKAMNTADKARKKAKKASEKAKKLAKEAARENKRRENSIKSKKALYAMGGIVAILLVFMAIFGDSDKEEKSAEVEQIVEESVEGEIKATSRLIEYDISDVEDASLFKTPETAVIAEKLTTVDNVNHTLKTSGSVYIVSSDLIEDGVTDLEVVEKVSKYGGVIETFSNHEDANSRALQLDEKEEPEQLILAGNLVIRLNDKVKSDYMDNIIKGIGSPVVEIEEAEELAKEEESEEETDVELVQSSSVAVNLSTVPEYSSSPYAVINNNSPDFSDVEKKNVKSFENYSNLDSRGRCGVAFANICKEIMPTEKRGPIGSIRPSGWHTIKYDVIPDRYLFNRCHLIGFQLAGENANAKNLITGTRYLNVEGMLPFENMVSDYVERTKNHVLYRVTPIFDDNNLVASGVQMEAWSVEDEGKGICFNVYCYNVQPGVDIDYATGESKLAEKVSSKDINAKNNNTNSSTTEGGDGSSSTSVADNNSNSSNNSGVSNPTNAAVSSGVGTYILNTSTKKYHTPGCKSINNMKDKNKQTFTGDKSELSGYSPCGNCHP